MGGPWQRGEPLWTVSQRLAVPGNRAKKEYPLCQLIMGIELPKPSKSFTHTQREAFEEMRRLLLLPSRADAEYDALPRSNGGTIISTDIARFLDKVCYAKEPLPGQSRDIEPSWDLAWRYAQDRLERELNKRGRRKRFRLMAGGWGAGKSYALRNEPTRPPDLVWDGTLSERRWAADRIDQAIKNNWKIEIAYVYRDLELALYGAVQREREVGRGVPLDELPANHRKVQQSVLDLTEFYREHGQVSFLYLHNLGVPEVKAQTAEIKLDDLVQNGALHYLIRHECYYQRAARNLGKEDHQE